MKNIVIPTDFSVHSLQLVSRLAEHYRGEQLDITLLYALNMPTDLMDLLFIHQRNPHQELAGAGFTAACEIMENKYASVIRSLKVRVVYGNNRRIIRNLLDAGNITEIVLPKESTLQPTHPDAVDLVPLLKKSGKPVRYLPLQAVTGVQKELLANLLMAG